MRFGLSEQTILALKSILSSYSAIEKSVIFGSRVTDTYRKGSDIDIAIYAPAMCDSEFTKLWAEIQDLPLIYKIDLLHFETLSNQDLKDKIERDGKSL